MARSWMGEDPEFRKDNSRTVSSLILQDKEINYLQGLKMNILKNAIPKLHINTQTNTCTTVLSESDKSTIDKIDDLIKLLTDRIIEANK